MHDSYDLPDGYTAEIHYDPHAEDPRTAYDHPGLIFPDPDADTDLRYADSMREALCSAGYYYDPDDISEAADLRAFDELTDEQVTASYLRREYGAVDFCAHDWTGYCQGDFGTVYVCATAEAYEAGYLPGVPAALRATAEEVAAYLRGDACGYVLFDPKGEEVDSCWGFYGSDYALSAARSVARFDVEEARRLDAAVRAATPDLSGATFYGCPDPHPHPAAEGVR